MTNKQAWDYAKGGTNTRHIVLVKPCNCGNKKKDVSLCHLKMALTNIRKKVDIKDKNKIGGLFT